MKLHVDENNISRTSIYYPEWTEQYFVRVQNDLKPNSSNENKKTNAIIKNRIVNNLTEGYVRLKTRFMMDNTQIDDEYDTLIRMIDIMSYGQYCNFASCIIEPYQHLEYDDDSLNILKVIQIFF